MYIEISIEPDDGGETMACCPHCKEEVIIAYVDGPTYRRSMCRLWT